MRLTLTGGFSPDGYPVSTPKLIITQLALADPTEAAFERGISMTTHAHQPQLPQAKSIDYLMALYLQPRLAETGADDVLYHQNNEMRACPRANFFVVTGNGFIVTPRRHILEGITRQQVLRLAGHKAIRKAIPLSDLPFVQEAFITSTTKGILPVNAIDGRIIRNGKPGRVTGQLAAKLWSAIMEQVMKPRAS